MRIGLGCGLQVGVNIRAAKAVNRLLGVADQKQRPLLRLKQGAENLVLQRVGVLKFVNQGHLPIFRYGAGKGFTMRVVGKRGVHVQ